MIKIVPVQAANLMGPPLQMQRARNHIRLVYRLSIIVAVDGNHEARLLLHAG